ncbi:hypothetical protein IW261DRAFT_1427780 [Armillaria novae-zelandiae]|uniref:Uncharacterized protein n=1 Tax=Armillaria novae-zelandiae TaxID=153914 RepID=A0AA39NCX0_9AGAR|nr:hypothetical protein IW261DRAFT_1427780 [Armillaria novae-zelandiae]
MFYEVFIGIYFWFRSGEVECAAEPVAASTVVGYNFLAGDWMDGGHARTGRFGHRSWRCYMCETKAIWVKARQHQREMVELKGLKSWQSLVKIPAFNHFVPDYSAIIDVLFRRWAIYSLKSTRQPPLSFHESYASKRLPCMIQFRCSGLLVAACYCAVFVARMHRDSIEKRAIDPTHVVASHQMCFVKNFGSRESPFKGWVHDDPASIG